MYVSFQGVFCVATDSAEHLQAISETNVFTCEVEYFYQKPSISELNRCIYSTEIDSGENQVLIDTGMVFISDASCNVYSH